MPPRTLGPSQTVPGAVDVETEDGQIFAVEPGLASVLAGPAPAQPMGGMGAGAPMANGPQPAAVDPLAQYRVQQPMATDAPAPGSPGAQVQQAINDVRAMPPAQAQAPGAPGALPPKAPTIEPAAHAPVQGAVFAGGGAQRQGGPDEGRLQLLDNLTGGRISGRGGGGGGGPVTTTTQTSEQTLTRPTEQQAQALDLVGMEQGVLQREQRDRIAAQGDRQATQAQAMYDSFQQGQAELAGIEAERAAIRQEREQARADYVRRADELSQAVASGRVDRGRIWSDEGAAGQAGAAIAIAVGSLVEGLTGAPNRALQIINTAIEQDIQEQLANMDADRAAASDARSLVGLADQGLDSVDQQTALLREAKLGDVARQIEGLDLANQPAEVQQAAQQMLAEIEAQAVEARRAGIMAGVERVTVQRQAVQRSGGGGGRRGLSVGDAIRVAEFAGAGAPEVDREGLRNVSSRLEAQVRAEQAVGEVRRLLGSDEDVPGVGILEGRIPDTLNRVYGALGSDGASRSNEMRRAVRDTVGSALRARSGAAISEDEINQELTMLGLGETSSNEEFLTGLRNFEEQLRLQRGVIEAAVDDPSIRAFDQRVNARGGAQRPTVRGAGE